MIAVLVLSVVSVSAFAEGGKRVDRDACVRIKGDLLNLKHDDAKARTHLGYYFETILNKFIVPLNMRLVENSITGSATIDIQGQFAEMLQTFKSDYTAYQKELDNLVAVNCEENTKDFYPKLEVVRSKRQTVAQDVLRLRSLAGKHVEATKKIAEENTK